MKRKQHHYTNEQQILDKIDAKRQQIKDLNERSEDLENKSISLLREFADKCSDIDWQDLTEDERNLKAMGIDAKGEALRARKTAKRIEEITLPKLGEVLAEFRTLPMIPVCGDDHSVASLV